MILETIQAGAPIRMISDMILRPAMRVQLKYKDETHDVMPMLQQFAVETRRCLDILLHGLAAPDDPEDPVDVGPA